MSRKLTAKLAIGPMSHEVVEAVYDFSAKRNVQLMLIASKNQIDHSSGYVNGWTTRTFAEHLERLKKRYTGTNVVVCRDHCGPGFNGIDDIQDTYRTVDEDIAAGFDLIHVDLCHIRAGQRRKLLGSKQIIEHILRVKPSTMIEIGTDEIGSVDDDLDKVRDEVDFFHSFCNPEFYVVRTGSLVKEVQQVGTFAREHTERLHKLLNERGMKLKEHNADYLTQDGIRLRHGVVDAVNIAPQLGVVQTRYILERCDLHGISTDEFKNRSYESKKWSKWLLDDEHASDKELCALVAGHYNFMSDEYKRMCDSLQQHQAWLEFDIIDEIQRVLAAYVSNL